jgi:hypothetical protein
MDLQSCLLGFLALFHIAQFGAMMHWCQWKREKFINAGLSKYVEFLESRHWTKCDLCDENESICGLLGGYLIAFVKTFACSTVHSFGVLLTFQQLEVELCKSWIAIHNVNCTKRSGHSSLLWVQELEINSYIHLV